MIDRIEELLSQMAAEDGEEREDVPAQKRGKVVSEGAWTGARASDGAIGPRDQPESEGKRPSDLTALQRDNGEAKPYVANRRSVTTEKREAEDRCGGRTAEEIMLELPGLAAGETETAAESAKTAGEFWKDGPVWTVRGGLPEINGALRAAAAERTARTGAEWAAQGGRAGRLDAGLEGLYRQTVQGLRPAAPALPPEQAGRTVRAQEPGSAASLAVDELDRAVRRDSRRYDGGMSIY